MTSQILDVRRRAAGFAAAVMAVSFLLRMVANSTDGRAWLGWLTPFGWMDHLAPFGDPQLSALLVLIVVPVLLLVAAAQIRNRRDTGGALLGTNDSRRPRLRGLGGPAIFAWRTNLPVLTGWVLGLGAYAFVLGALLTTMIDFLARDANYQRTLADLGLDSGPHRRRLRRRHECHPGRRLRAVRRVAHRRRSQRGRVRSCRQPPHPAPHQVALAARPCRPHGGSVPRC